MKQNSKSSENLIVQVKSIFLEQIPFNKYVGMQIERLNFDVAKKFCMAPTGQAPRAEGQE